MATVTGAAARNPLAENLPLHDIMIRALRLILFQHILDGDVVKIICNDRIKIIPHR